MSSEILDSRPQVGYSPDILQFTSILALISLFTGILSFQLPFGIMSRGLEEGYGNDFDYDDEVDIEYCVYDVTPDVSIDFVSFTTEESEGKINWTQTALKTFLISSSVISKDMKFLFTLEVKSHPSQCNMLFSVC